ncbi:MAG: SsrA-binding protein SmpB [Patescibacteria group bacterium]
MALVENKKARLEYEVLDTYEAGIELFGHEVKALRAGKASLAGSHVVVRAGECYLVGATISPYQTGNTPKSYEPERTRRLLLNKKELRELDHKASERGLTIIPLSVYNSRRRLKLGIAIARKKKKYDKRETLKERSDRRDIDRTLKNK